MELDPSPVRTYGAADMAARTQEKTPTMPPGLKGGRGAERGMYAAPLGPIRGKGGADTAGWFLEARLTSSAL